MRQHRSLSAACAGLMSFCAVPAFAADGDLFGG